MTFGRVVGDSEENDLREIRAGSFAQSEVRLSEGNGGSLRAGAGRWNVNGRSIAKVALM